MTEVHQYSYYILIPNMQQDFEHGAENWEVGSNHPDLKKDTHEKIDKKKNK